MKSSFPPAARLSAGCGATDRGGGSPSGLFLKILDRFRVRSSLMINAPFGPEILIFSASSRFGCIVSLIRGLDMASTSRYGFFVAGSARRRAFRLKLPSYAALGSSPGGP